MSSSRIHCCHITIGIEFKEKHILEQDQLFCCAIISSGRKEKSLFFSSLRTPDPYSLLESPRPLSPPQGPHLPTYLGIDSPTNILYNSSLYFINCLPCHPLTLMETH